MSEILTDRPLRVAALAKQIPICEGMDLDEDGRLIRGTRDEDSQMNDYCRRAVAMGHRIARASDKEISSGEILVLTMGPPQAENILREAILYGVDSGAILCDEELAGSDTLATARALAQALKLLGPFDLILCGRNSLDGDTGQVPPQIAQILDLPFASGVKELRLKGETLSLGLEHNDEFCTMEVEMPAMLSCAERLIDPCKIKDPTEWAKADTSKITWLTTKDIEGGIEGDGATGEAQKLSQKLWGLAGSPTKVGKVKTLKQERLGKILLDSQLNECAEIMGQILSKKGPEKSPRNLEEKPHDLTALLLLEAGKPTHSRELITKAARLVKKVQIIETPAGRNEILPDDFANGVVKWIQDPPTPTTSSTLLTPPPDFILAPSTDWGREVASRIAASLGCGLVGDAIDIYISENISENPENPEDPIQKRQKRLVCLKPAFGGTMAAEIYCESTPQMATIREGVFRIEYPDTAELEYPLIEFPKNSRIKMKSRVRMDESAKLANAKFVVGIGLGVDPKDITEIAEKTAALGGELAATRKVTDLKHLPRARQIGITGHSIAPAIYVALGISGNFNHTVGLTQSQVIISINNDPKAEIFSTSDIGIVGDYKTIFLQFLENPKIISKIESITHH